MEGTCTRFNKWFLDEMIIRLAITSNMCQACGQSLNRSRIILRESQTGYRVGSKAVVKTTIRCTKTRIILHLPPRRIISIRGERRSLTDTHLACMQLASNLAQLVFMAVLLTRHNGCKRPENISNIAKAQPKICIAARWEKEKSKRKSLSSLSLRYFGSTFHLSK